MRTPGVPEAHVLSARTVVRACHRCLFETVLRDGAQPPSEQIRRGSRLPRCHFDVPLPGQPAPAYDDFGHDGHDHQPNSPPPASSAMAAWRTTTGEAGIERRPQLTNLRAETRCQHLMRASEPGRTPVVGFDACSPSTNTTSSNSTVLRIDATQPPDNVPGRRSRSELRAWLSPDPRYAARPTDP